MTYLDLTTLKKHLNIEAEFIDDDTYIESLGEVAEAIVERHCGVKLEDIAINNGGVLPPPVVHAMMLFVGNMYMNRESVSVAAYYDIPHSYEYLLSAYKNYNNCQA